MNLAMVNADTRPTYCRNQTELLSIVEVGRQLRVSRWQVYQLINSRQLRSVHIGRRHLVATDELQRYVQRLRLGERTDS